MKHIIPFLVAAILIDACAPKTPVTRKDNTVDNYFGTEVADPYRWLEDDASDETAAWVEAQNKVTNAYLKKIPFRAKLLQRLTEVSNYEKVGVPGRRKNGKWYYYRNNGLQNQSVLYEMDSPDAEPHVFLDPNTLSDDGTVALKGVYFSNDGKYAAYTISRSGSDWEEIYVMDANTRELLEDHIVWAKFTGASWRGDGFYYSAYDAPEGDGHEFSGKNEVHKIYYHKVGTPQSEDQLFFSNPAEPLRFYQVSINDEETMAFLYEDGADVGNNLYVMDLRKPGAKWVQITRDMKNACTTAETDGDKIYLFTNLDAPMNKLVVTDIKNPKVWKDVIPEGDCVLEDVSFIMDLIIASYSKDASTHAYLYNLEGTRLEEIHLPGVGSAGFNCRKGEPWCYYSYASFTTPGTVYHWNIETGESTVYKQPQTAFDLSDMESEQVFFPSKDGTMIPMFITHKKDIKLDGSNPVYLYGYGGFNISLPPSFSATMVPWFEHGGVYAQVNLRGGSEYGEAWHLAGTKMQKQNVFDDFIGAAEWLIANGYTSSEKLAIVGGSNGGLLVGACMTQRPELYAVAIPRVGVMDMLRYHKFTIGWNWAPDYGTSEDSEEMFKYLYGYSPLHNLKPGTKYPATLVTTADHDDRVVPAHSFKFAATLQECNAGDKPQLIRIDSKAGHGGGKPLAKVLEEQADIYSFIMKNLGMKY
ncbi:MAG: prolyl oligopeptidase family serine peptidase [Bacteroidales bacterium]|nr:prolyl oligopeptidase family serine peptidase [Bacteroidales bacterium]